MKSATCPESVFLAVIGGVVIEIRRLCSVSVSRKSILGWVVVGRGWEVANGLEGEFLSLHVCWPYLV